MSLIGKKYPDNLEDFYKARLPGTWDEERAGKRMKLPVPETWETQVSLKGNKATTWQQLLDNKKLPFMAMLRNLRNLIKAGISSKHHAGVIRRLTDERQVINSRQFPFRFFSAYEALTQLAKEYEQNQSNLVSEAEAKAGADSHPPGPMATRGRGLAARGRGRGAGRGRKGGRAKPKGTGFEWWLKKKAKNQGTKEVSYDMAIIGRYKKALDVAVQIATKYNVQPIKGRTWIFCNVDDDMDSPCQSAKGLGKPRTRKEIGILMGLMCKYSCEESQMILFDGTDYSSVDLQKGTILENMEAALKATPEKQFGIMYSSSPAEHSLPFKVFYDALRDRQQIDNLIIISEDNFQLEHFLPVYRRLVNPNLVFASISLKGYRAGFSDEIVPAHDNDIYISGYSDQILRYIAEKSDGGQLLHVENIDEAYKLKAIATVALDTTLEKEITKATPEKPLPIVSQVPRWRTARVFISSTFRDMHGERDLLTRFVFPELRDRGSKRFINIYEVDLRWGVTEEDTKNNRALSLCLQEIKRCQFFLGILAERYGYMPETYDVPDTSEYDWVKNYPAGASVTELEMHYGALAGPQAVAERAFFYFRDRRVEYDIPNEFIQHFKSESEETNMKMNKLKNRIRGSGLEVYDGYPSRWAGVVNDKALVGGLEDFGLRVINNLWTAIEKYYPDESAMLDEESHNSNLHDAFVEDRQSQFIGRTSLIKQCITKITSLKHGLLGIVGKSGCGKSSLMCRLIHQYLESKHCSGANTVVVHMVGAAPGSTNIVATIRRLSHHLNAQFGLQMKIQEEYRNLVVQFGDILEEASKLCRSKLVLFIDGVDLMEQSHQPYSLEWLPKPLPKNVAIVMSVLEGDKYHQSLKRLAAEEIIVTGLDMFDKSEIIRKTLATHRKTLDESPFNNQLKLLVSKKEAPNPLFLKLACDELRVYGLFDKMSQKLKSLPHTIPALLQEILLRLETDHGCDLISTTLCLLVSVRNGLLSEELWDLLNYQRILGKSRFTVMDIVNTELKNDNIIPPAIFSYLRRSIQGFLNPTSSSDSRLELAHVEISQAVRHRYLKGVAALELEMNLHKLLAGYFYRLADPENNGSFTGNNTRAFSELVYHLTRSGSFKELEKVICNSCYINQKCHLGLAADLLDDYTPKHSPNKSLEREQNKLLTSLRVQDYKSFVSRNIHIFTSYPALTWQQVLNEPDSSTVLKDYRLIDNTPTQYMIWQNRPDNVDACYQTISNLKHAVTCVAISPDSLYFATGGKDCIVRLYDLQTGKEVKMFCGHSDPISDVCFAGKTILCSASYDNSVSLWHVDNGHRIAVLSNHKRRVNSCSANESGKLVATASWDCTVRVWSTSKGEQECYLNVGSPVNCVDFHPEGQLIVTGSWDSLIKIWDVFHKTRKAVLRGHTTSVRDVAYSPSGRHIASASLDGMVKLWSALNGTQVGNIQGHSLPINKLTFTATGHNLVTVSDDQKVKIWSEYLGVPVHCLGSESDGPVTSVALSSDGCHLVAGYHEGQIRGYDVKSGMRQYSVKHSSSAVKVIKFTTGDKNILIGVDNGNIMLLTQFGGQKVSLLRGHSKNVLCIDTTKEYIVTGGEDSTCCVYTNVKKIKTSKQVEADVILHHHTAAVTGCSFNTAGTMFATSSRDGSVMIWDIKIVLLNPEAPPIQYLNSCHSDWINGCIWSNIGDHLVTASNDFNLKIWDVKLDNPEEQTSEKQRLTGHMSAINCLSYQFGCIVSGCSDGSVKVWSHKGTEITTLHGHTQRVNGCSMYVKTTEEEVPQEEDKEEDAALDCSDWSVDPEPPKKKSKKPASKLSDVVVATCSDDGTIRIWRPLQAYELASLTGHSDRVISVAADRTGNVCTSSLDKSVRLWSPKLSEDIPVGRHDSDITFTVASIDKKMVLTGSRDGCVKIWRSDNYDEMKCCYSFQADETSVNAACFINKAGTKFVTTDNRNNIAVWDITEKDGVTLVTLNHIFVSETLILSVTWGQHQPELLRSVFWTLDWKGSLCGWNLNTKKCQFKKRLDENIQPFGTLYKVKFAGNSADILVTTTREVFGFINYKELVATEYDIQALDLSYKSVLEDDEDDDEESDEDDTPVAKRERTWILDMAQDTYHCYYGDSKGQLTLYKVEEDTVFTMKVHSAAINCVVRTPNYLFTGSADCTIKVWDLKAIQNWELDNAQVGQFFCTSPVLTLIEIKNTNSAEVKLMSGDQLGNITMLTWVSG
ncbi:telomerase protein component 1 [Patella vulgata]|uniref:telomerase protein component 1 n=1 Tax=Patella vulgata TaxID=6465 RepID=UPI0024A9ACB1|nr:telomerase protein component 1 [Patella vulgata]